MVYELTQENFTEEIENSEIPVLVDMYAEWCGSCRNLSPIIDRLAEEQEGNLKVCKININAAPRIAAQYKVESIPTCILFEEGDISAEVVGARDKQELEDEIGILNLK